METIDFNEVVRDNIEVVGGLLQSGDLTKNGLMPMGRSFKIYTGTMKEFGNDANLLHKFVDIGESVFQVVSGTINTPSQRGMLKHIQRLKKNDVSGSQEITQFAYDTSKTYIRRGQGNGTSINYSDWETL